MEDERKKFEAQLQEKLEEVEEIHKVSLHPFWTNTVLLLRAIYIIINCM